jgi:hypothetical protein
MKKIIVLLLTILTTLTFATDIKLKNGSFITNIEITKETDLYVEFLVGESKRRIPKDSIEEIRVLPVNLSRPANVPDIFENEPPKIIIGQYKPTYLLPVAALSLLVSYNYLSDASDLNDQIEETSKLPYISESDLEDSKDKETRYKIVGYGALIAGAALVYISFQDFNVYATLNKLQISYKLD